MTTPATALNNYERPTLDKAARYQIGQTVSKIMLSRDRHYLAAILLNALYENAMLTAECNQHRAARGFSPLSTFSK